VGGADGRVKRAFGEDGLQTILLACEGLRGELQLVGASWLGLGSSGIPPSIPYIFGTEFTGRLEALVEREVVKLTAKLKRAHERRAEQRRGKLVNQTSQPASPASRKGRSRR
jgi:hypothetical protein